MRTDHDKNERSSRLGHHQRDLSGWPKGSSGGPEEPALVVCSSCWRCVSLSLSASAASCPRCGEPLPLLGGSTDTPLQISGAVLSLDVRYTYSERSAIASENDVGIDTLG